MTCPDCTRPGSNCTTCGGDGTVPDWLADPKVNGDAAKSWRAT